MAIVITAFERSPDGGKGLARDTRVRWALEEVGQPYEVCLVSFQAKKEEEHLGRHPFGHQGSWTSHRTSPPTWRVGRSDPHTRGLLPRS